MNDTERIIKEIREVDSRLSNKIDEVDSKLGNQITEIKLLIENDIQKQIQVIAEGHFDLNRKLDEALQISEEMELMKLHLIHHDIEIDSIKKKLHETA